MDPLVTESAPANGSTETGLSLADAISAYEGATTFSVAVPVPPTRVFVLWFRRYRSTAEITEIAKEGEKLVRAVLRKPAKERGPVPSPQDAQMIVTLSRLCIGSGEEEPASPQEGHLSQEEAFRIVMNTPVLAKMIFDQIEINLKSVYGQFVQKAIEEEAESFFGDRREPLPT